MIVITHEMGRDEWEEVVRREHNSGHYILPSTIGARGDFTPRSFVPCRRRVHTGLGRQLIDSLGAELGEAASRSSSFSKVGTEQFLLLIFMEIYNIHLYFLHYVKIQLNIK